jgi:hypothetical protein
MINTPAHPTNTIIPKVNATPAATPRHRSRPSSTPAATSATHGTSQSETPGAVRVFLNSHHTATVVTSVIAIPTMNPAAAGSLASSGLVTPGRI